MLENAVVFRPPAMPREVKGISSFSKQYWSSVDSWSVIEYAGSFACMNHRRCCRYNTLKGDMPTLRSRIELQKYDSMPPRKLPHIRSVPPSGAKIPTLQKIVGQPVDKLAIPMAPRPYVVRCAGLHHPFDGALIIAPKAKLSLRQKISLVGASTIG